MFIKILFRQNLFFQSWEKFYPNDIQTEEISRNSSINRNNAGNYYIKNTNFKDSNSRMIFFDHAGISKILIENCRFASIILPDSSAERGAAIKIYESGNAVINKCIADKCYCEKMGYWNEGGQFYLCESFQDTNTKNEMIETSVIRCADKGVGYAPISVNYGKLNIESVNISCCTNQDVSIFMITPTKSSTLRFTNCNFCHTTVTDDSGYGLALYWLQSYDLFKQCNIVNNTVQDSLVYLWTFEVNFSQCYFFDNSYQYLFYFRIFDDKAEYAATMHMTDCYLSDSNFSITKNYDLVTINTSNINTEKLSKFENLLCAQSIEVKYSKCSCMPPPYIWKRLRRH